MSFKQGAQIGTTLMNFALTGKKLQEDIEDRELKKRDRAEFKKESGGMSKAGAAGKAAKASVAVLEDQARLSKAREDLGKLSDADILQAEPTTYAQHVAVAERINSISTNTANRVGIDAVNKKKANDAYNLSLEALNEATNKYNAGDSGGTVESLTKIGNITNNPFKVRPNPDGRTVTLYTTQDGVDQEGQTLTIPEALKVAQDHLSGPQFFESHLQNREARRTLNNKSVLEPIVFEKGNKSVRAVRQLDLNSNNVKWSFYDEKGKKLPFNNITELREKGWKQLIAKDLSRELKVLNIAEKKKAAKGGMTKKEQRAHNAKRIEYVDDKMEDYIAENAMATKEEQETRRKIFAKEYDDEVLGTEEEQPGKIIPKPKVAAIKRNKKTGETVYLDIDGNVIRRGKPGEQTRYKIGQR